MHFASISFHCWFFVPLPVLYSSSPPPHHYEMSLEKLMPSSLGSGLEYRFKLLLIALLGSLPPFPFKVCILEKAYDSLVVMNTRIYRCLGRVIGFGPIRHCFGAIEARPKRCRFTNINAIKNPKSLVPLATLDPNHSPLPPPNVKPLWPRFERSEQGFIGVLAKVRCQPGEGTCGPGAEALHAQERNMRRRRLSLTAAARVCRNPRVSCSLMRVFRLVGLSKRG
ncbi:uncharacterized protein LOC105769585 [Gossypium raimondii]|uniref:uncharacterized protein LOC105769585 n=1 Tax=Gossypium raimondii TaxID=29730 RepID=UPI00227B5DAA|nr:uncharacterized protein LOC105769585 [Gossypium raimondii]